MAETFYEVVMNGVYHGKDNKNILYYRTGIDLAGGAFGFGGASDLADNLMQELVPAYLAVKPSEYILQSIDISVKNALFTPVYQLPYRRGVNMPGTKVWPGDQSDGPAIAANFRFNLEPKLFGLGLFPAPKRGYLAIGPILSSWIDNAGKLTDGVFTPAEHTMDDLAVALSSNIEQIVPVPAVWFPIRVRKVWGPLGVGSTLLGWGYADIESCTVDRNTTYRRSRRVSA